MSRISSEQTTASTAGVEFLVGIWDYFRYRVHTVPGFIRTLKAGLADIIEYT